MEKQAYYFDSGPFPYQVACADAQSDLNSEPETRMDARGLCRIKHFSFSRH